MSIRLRDVRPSSKKPVLPKKIGRFSPLALGVTAVGLLGAGFLLFREGTANAATPPAGPGPSPQPPSPGPKPPAVFTGPAGTPSAQLVVGQSATVVAPSGIKLRTGPGTRFPGVGFLTTKASDGTDILGLGSVVAIADKATADGWVKVQVPGGTGFLCNDCKELNFTGVPIQASLHMTPGKPELVANKQIPSAGQPTSSESLSALGDVLTAIANAGDTTNAASPGESQASPFFGPDGSG